MSRNVKRQLINLLKFFIGCCITAIVIGPLLITFFAAFKSPMDMVTVSPLVLPPLENITFDNIIEVATQKTLPYAVRNILIILVVSIFFNVMIGSSTAFVLERFDFKFKNVIYLMFFAGMMVPTAITEIARFKIIHGMGLYNTLGAPIVIYVASDLMQLYIYRQFISKISVSLDESARLDGCSYFMLFRKIIFPLLAPATSTLIIIKSVNIINDMYVPYLYMPKSELRTLTTFLMGYANAESGSWQKLSAAVLLILIPTFIIYIFFQNKIVDGLSAGAVKE